MAYQHNHRHAPRFVLLWAISIVTGFALVEALVGWYAGSLALLSDAGHMFTDTFSLMIAALASWLAEKPASKQHTYGLGRAEVLGGWISSLIIIVLAMVILIEAVERFQESQPVSGLPVMAVATLGLVVNLFVGWLVSRGERTINIRAALLHILGDILGSIAALISGTVIYFTGWTLIDPILSIFISLLIMASAMQLLRESFLVLMEGVPSHIDVHQVGRDMAEVNQVQGVHDLHIWTLATGQFILTAHVEIEYFEQWQNILDDLLTLLRNRYGIEHVTLQPEVHTAVVPVPSTKYKKQTKGGSDNDR